MPIVYLMVVWVAIIAQLVLLAIPFCGLIPAWKLGPASPGDPGRLMAAWVAACVLNLIATIVPFVWYLVPYGCLLAAFGIASCVGGIAGHRSWLFGSIASYWFVLPWLVIQNHFVPPTQIATHGEMSLLLLLFTFGAGVAGGLMSSLVLRWRASLTLER